MRDRRSWLVAALTLLAGCGGPLLGAQIDESRLCLVLPSQTVPAAPTAPPGAVVPEQTVTWEGDVDVGSVIPGLSDGTVTGSIHALSLTTTANPATVDLETISAADVEVIDASGKATAIMHYTRPDPATPTDHLDMTVGQDVNLLPQLKGGVLQYRITFKGLPPRTTWTADLETCLSANVTIDALEL